MAMTATILGDVCDFVHAPFECKFIGDNSAETGQIEGYGSVFGNQDWHGDLIEPGAFDAVLTAYKSAGTWPGMFVEHSAYLGGDPLPVGVWSDVAPDSKGLHVRGHLIALDTDHGRRVYSALKERAITGLSIAHKPGRVTMGTKAGEPKRTIHDFKAIASIDLVRDPSNAQARIEAIKAMVVQADHATAVDAIRKAAALHQTSTMGGNSPNADQRQMLMGHLNTAHRALTGSDCPQQKSMPETIREFEAMMRDAFRWSNSQARAVGESGFKGLGLSQPRDEDAAHGAIRALSSAVAGFKL